MASMTWQISASGIPLAVPTLSHLHSAYSGRSLATKSRPALADIFPLSSLSSKSHSQERPLAPLVAPVRSTAFTVSDEYNGTNKDIVILKSSDGLKFRVPKEALGQASTVFRRLFASQPRRSEDTTSTEYCRASSSTSVVCFSDELSKDGFPFIHVSEDSKSLYALLRFLYHGTSKTPNVNSHGDRGNMQTVDDIKPVLTAAQKYDMPLAMDGLCACLLSLLTKSAIPDPDFITLLRVYALACRYGRRDLAIAAARASLLRRVSGAYFPELEELPAVHYFRLLDYHQRAASAISALFKVDGSGLPATYAKLLSCTDCSPDIAAGGTAGWWTDFAARAGEEVRNRPCSQKIFDSKFLEDMYQRAERCTDDCRATVRAKWLTLSLVIKEQVDRVLSKVELDLKAFDPPSDERAICVDEGRISRIYRKFATIK
ncbi:hypothetical protein DFH11DRAFT_1618282 [Phellopilus nigrolimitatus]|nr:hypothetical protein DFH11DRAFT_1618282 [Phellopilus nigrolimitatus]